MGEICPNGEMGQKIEAIRRLRRRKHPLIIRNTQKTCFTIEKGDNYRLIERRQEDFCTSSLEAWCETRKIIFQGSQPPGFQVSWSGVLGLMHQVSRSPITFLKTENFDPGEV